MRHASLFALALVFVGCTKDEETDTADTTDTDSDADTDADADSDTDADTDSDTDTDTTSDTGGWWDTGWYYYDYGYDVTFDGTGYDPHEGMRWEFAVYDAEGLFVDYDDGTVETGVIDAWVWWALQDGESYYADLIVDHNGNRLCDAAPTDHAWRYDIPTVTDDVAITDTHNTTFETSATVCEGWSTWHYDVALTGTGYTPHAGQTIHYALVDTDTQEVYFTADDVVGTDGSISVSFTDAFAPYTPYLDLVYYVESNATAGCQPLTDGAHDHQWSVPLYNDDLDLTLTRDHDTVFEDVCWAFDVPV